MNRTRKFTRLLAVAFLMCTFLVLSSQSVFAASQTTAFDNGVHVTTAFDKDVYTPGETATLTITLENTNSYTILLENGINLAVPEDVAAQISSDIPTTIAAGDTVIIEAAVIYTAEDTDGAGTTTSTTNTATSTVTPTLPTTNDSDTIVNVETGDNSKAYAMLAIGAVALIVVLLCAKRTGRATLSLVLCLSLFTTMSIGTIGNVAQAQETDTVQAVSNKAYSVDTVMPVNVSDGADEPISVSMTVEMVLSSYADTDNWAFIDTENAVGSADIFYVSQTVYNGEFSNMPLSTATETEKKTFAGAIRMQKAIYDGSLAENKCRFFAPYYRQQALSVYADSTKSQQCLAMAFEDVKAAFEYYMDNYNQGRPIIIAGFSQGADMCIRLLKECFADPVRQKQLVACYAIGWRFTEEDAQACAENNIHFATGAYDVNSVISFNTEAENAEGTGSAAERTVMVPTSSLCINPANWSTATGKENASTLEDNDGAFFLHPLTGTILSTAVEPGYTTAYIDEERGTLVLPEATNDAARQQLYNLSFSMIGQGSFHLYDCMFFYKDLIVNVQTRLKVYEMYYMG